VATFDECRRRKRPLVSSFSPLRWDSKGACHASTSIAAKKSAIGSGSALEDSGGVVRVGIVHYNTADEVDLLLGELETA
jgi:selenocysteine lyase/cysteine desulfurase